jgi:hypothetical protein
MCNIARTWLLLHIRPGSIAVLEAEELIPAWLRINSGAFQHDYCVESTGRLGDAEVKITA